MEIRDWYELKSKLCKTADEMHSRKSYDRADLDVIEKFTHSICNINKIIDHEEGNSYGYGNSNSRGGMWSAEGSYNGGMSRDGYSMRGYSRAGEMDDMRMDRVPRNY